MHRRYCSVCQAVFYRVCCCEHTAADACWVTVKCVYACVGVSRATSFTHQRRLFHYCLLATQSCWRSGRTDHETLCIACVHAETRLQTDPPVVRRRWRIRRIKNICNKKRFNSTQHDFRFVRFSDGSRNIKTRIAYVQRNEIVKRRRRLNLPVKTLTS